LKYIGIVVLRDDFGKDLANLEHLEVETVILEMVAILLINLLYLAAGEV
jgi:hypothetical protein